MIAPIRRVVLPVLAMWFAMALLVGVTDARIKRPHFQELVDSADAIVIGRAETVRPAPLALSFKISGVLLLLLAALALACGVFESKKTKRLRFLVAAIVVVSVFLLFEGFQVHNRVADIHVLSRIVGSDSPHNISVYFDTGIVCDTTELDPHTDYVLFLRSTPTGYALSWPVWSVWALKGGRAQVEGNGEISHTAVPVDELVSHIKCLYDKINPRSLAPGRS